MASKIKKPKLTDKQAKFVREYLIDLNATQAAIRAGYSKKTAQRMGSENLSKLVIKEAISKQTLKATEKVKLTVETVLNNIEDMRARAKKANNFAGEGTACTLQAKYLKMLTDKIALEVPEGIKLTINGA